METHTHTHTHTHTRGTHTHTHTHTWHPHAATDQTAVLGEDYLQPSSMELSFADGEREKQLTVQVLDDSTPELDEFFHLTLTNPPGGSAIIGVLLSERAGTVYNTVQPNSRVLLQLPTQICLQNRAVLPHKATKTVLFGATL